MDCCRGWAGWAGRAIAFLVFLTMERSINDVRILFHVPPLSSPALPPALPVPLPLPAPARTPKEVCLSQGGRQSMLLRRRALCCIQIKNHFDLIFVVAGRSALSIVRYWTYRTLLLREKGVPANLQYRKLPTEFSSGIGLVNTKKYQPNTNWKNRIGIQLYIFGILVGITNKNLINYFLAQIWFFLKIDLPKLFYSPSLFQKMQ